jgi:protein-L-isoaspartate(D-aspartate) O-methyltransferase
MAGSLNRNALLAHKGLRDLPRARARMVERLAQQGFATPVVRVLEEVPKHAFVPTAWWRLAYSRQDLWTEAGVLPAPHTTALILHHLQPGPRARLLEVGTETGYQTVLLALLGATVVTVAARNLDGTADAIAASGLTNITQRYGDPTAGRPQAQPFDGIAVNLALPAIAPGLVEQLQPDGGRMVVPVGHPGPGSQRLLLIQRHSGDVHVTDLGAAYFPMSAQQSATATVLGGEAMVMEGAAVSIMEGTAAAVEGDRLDR